jgi:archaellum component FlaF (FlaF/FlaG flagellin family)
MKNFTLLIGLLASIVIGTTKADVVRVQYIDTNGIHTVKKAQPYYINPQSSLKVGLSAGVGRRIVAEIKDSNGVVVDTKTKSRVDSSDTFIVDGVTFFGAELEFNNIADGKYTLTSIVYNNSQVEVSRQNNDLIIDTESPQIIGDFYWNPFGQYVFKHTDGKFIVSRSVIQDAGFPRITVGVSGFSHATFTSEYLDGPKAGTKHAVDAPVTLTAEGKLVIGNGTPNSISSVYIPNDTSNQMRFTYRVHSKAGNSTSKSIDVYVATKTAVKPSPYGVYTGVESKLDEVNAFKGFVQYVEKMAIPSNPVRMIYRAPKSMYIGGGGLADIYGAWLNGNRGPNKVVHTDEQYIYFDVTGSSDGKQFSSIQLYTRDVSTWRTHLLEHDVVVPSGLEPPKVVNFNFYIQGLNEWVTSTGVSTDYITKDQTGGGNDTITKVKLVLEPRLYDQKYSFDFGAINSTYKGSCIVPAGQTECIINTSLPYPADDLNNYHNRVPVSNLTGTILGTEVVPTWMYDGSIAEMDPTSLTHDPKNKTFSVAFVNKFSDRNWGTSAIRALDGYAVGLNGTKTKLPRTNYTIKPINKSTTHVMGSFTYASLKDGFYNIEAYVEDGFNRIKSNKKAHVLFTDIVIDTTSPTVKTNINNQKVTNLSSIDILISDQSAVSLKSVLLTGGEDGVNISLPTVSKGEYTYSPEYIYIKPSETKLYSMTITVEDAYGNKTTKVENFYYSPKILALGNIRQPAISAPLKSDDGMPSNIIRTNQIKNDAGELAIGNHKVYFTLLPSAESSMVINGRTIAPGESHEFTVNLSKTNHRLVFEAYPAVSGKKVFNPFEINLVDLNVNICPALFQLNGTECIHLSFADPLLKCNTPYALVEGKCQLEVLYNPATTCLAGYTLDGTICRGIYTVNPFTMCPTGYSQVDESTCKEINTSALKVCPDGETIEEGFCKDAKGNTSPQKQFCQGKDISGGSFCDAGTCYDLKSDWNACQVSTTVPSIPVCQAGTLSAGVCQVTDQYQLNMQCPFGYIRDGLLCKRIEIIPPNKSCPTGYELVGNNCAKTEISPYISCPSTHELVNGRCHMKEAINISCPSTYTWDGSRCVKNEQKPAVPLCPAGYTLNGTECQKIDVIDATIVCPVNYHPENGRCTLKVSSPAHPVCPTSYIWDAGSRICKFQESQPASMNCPAGYTLNGNRCQIIETQSAVGSCSATDISNGYTWDGVSCNKSIVKAATPNCSAGYSWNGSSCLLNETMQASVNCPASYTWNGSVCSKTESEPAIMSCAPSHVWSAIDPETQTMVICEKNLRAQGNLIGGNCYYGNLPVCEVQGTCPRQHRPTNHPCNEGETTGYESASCSNGWTVNGSTCERTLTQAPTYSCPSGWIVNESICTRTLSDNPSYSCDPADGTLSGSNCVRTQTATTVYSCPATGNWNLSGGSCSRTLTESVSYSCPSAGGWVLNNLTCDRILTTSPTSYFCDAGQQLDGQSCNTYSYKDPDAFDCPANWLLDGKVCKLKTTSPITGFQCEQGWILDGQICRKDLYEPENRTCSVTQTRLDNSTCFENVPSTSVGDCPAGYTSNVTNCKQSLIEPPILSCNQNYDLIADQCHTTLVKAVTVECQHDEELRSGKCVVIKKHIPRMACQSPYRLDATKCKNEIKVPVLN